MERYSPTDDVWLSVAMMNNVRSSHAMVAMGDSIYTVGGNDGSSSLNSVERFDIKSNCWTMLPPMSTRRSNVGVAVAWILP